MRMRAFCRTRHLTPAALLLRAALVVWVCASFAGLPAAALLLAQARSVLASAAFSAAGTEWLRAVAADGSRQHNDLLTRQGEAAVRCERRQTTDDLRARCAALDAARVAGLGARQLASAGGLNAAVGDCRPEPYFPDRVSARGPPTLLSLGV
jgi:hypothetical protein